MKKLLALLLTAACALCLAFALAACKGGKHVHDYGELIPEKSATCTEEGLGAHYYCSGCQKYFDSQKNETTLDELKIAVDPTAHTYGTFIEKVEPTCAAEGTEAHYHCACNKYFDSQKNETTLDELKIAVDPTAHNYGELIEKPANCTEEGLKAHYHCACGKYFDSEKNETTLGELKIAVDKNAHNYGELIPEKTATCLGDGMYAHYHCDLCDKYFDIDKQETTRDELIDINPDGHSFVGGVCEYCEKVLYTKNADGTINMGEYPQSEVTEDGLKSTLGNEAGALPTAADAHGWTDYEYYESGRVKSYMWYIDVEYQSNRYRGVYFTSYRPCYTVSRMGETLAYYQRGNKYNPNTIYWFKYEPIKWRVLEQSN